MPQVPYPVPVDIVWLPRDVYRAGTPFRVRMRGKANPLNPHTVRRDAFYYSNLVLRSAEGISHRLVYLETSRSGFLEDEHMVQLCDYEMHLDPPSLDIYWQVYRETEPTCLACIATGEGAVSDGT